MKSGLGLIFLFCISANAVPAPAAPALVHPVNDEATPVDLAIAIESKSGELQPKLHFIATVDGISYFADIEQTRNWTEAREYCLSIGLELGQLRTTAVANALLDAYSPTTFHGHFWTAGREFRNRAAFIWYMDATMDTLRVPDVGLPLFYYGSTEMPDYYYCLAYSSESDQGGRYFIRLCQMKLYTICQTI